MLRPEPTSQYEAYMLQTMDKIGHQVHEILEKQEVHDTKFEAIFYCFGKHDVRLDHLEKQGEELLREMKRLRADNKVSEAYYNAVVQRISRLEMAAAG